MSTQSWCKQLWEMLNDHERAVLRLLLQKFTGCTSRKLYWRPIDEKTISGFLHQQIYGRFECDEEARQKVMDNIEKVRSFLAQNNHIASVLTEVLPSMPYTLRLENLHVGCVLVSPHAWERFCERFCKDTTDQVKVVELLKQYFTGAEPSGMDNVVRTIRTIVNREEATYLFNRKFGCRFVVALKDGIPTLVTAEVPRHQTEIA